MSKTDNPVIPVSATTRSQLPSGNIQSATGSATVASPPDFKMGKFQESYAGAKDFYAFSGGKPNSQWDGLNKGVKSTAYNPNQHCSADARNKAKSYSYRVKGLTSPFKEGVNVFQLS